MEYQADDQKKSQDDLDFYRKMKKSNECLCEQGKQPGMWFCFRCYKSLPADIQKALWKPLGAEAVEAYEKAVKYLGD